MRPKDILLGTVEVGSCSELSSDEVGGEPDISARRLKITMEGIPTFGAPEKW